MEKGELPKQLERVLACSVCKAKLKYSRLKKILTCTVCKTTYNVTKGIPIMTANKTTQRTKTPIKKKK